MDSKLPEATTDRVRNNRFKLQEGRIRLDIKREMLYGKKTVKHRKRFPGHTVQFPKMMFLNKNERSICWEWHRSDPLHHLKARGWPWCLLRAFQVLVTKFKILALTFSREASNARALVLSWKIHRFPVLTSNPRRNVELRFLIHDSCSWAFSQDSVIWWKTSLHCKLFQHLLIFTCYSNCCISFGTLEKAVAHINSELMVPLWHTNWLDG